MMSPEKWTDTQKERAEILFREFPDIKTAFSLTHSLRMIFSQSCTKEQGAVSLHSWYSKVGEFGNKAFNDIAAAMYDREDEILNILSIALPMHQQNPSMQRSSISEHNSEVLLTVSAFSSD